MSRGESFGGGKSSLSYLFESDEGTTSFEGSPKSTGQQKPPSDEDSKTKATDQSAAPNKPVSTNNYYRARGQNSGNFITGRPFTKVQSVPGGSSSLGYLFGDK
ncbi:protein SPIRAL1-like 5 [Musa acuminata AAA Group]|uniref:(wild Malaysian banana) hypothetical protein n=1 Tax=Musa acuminata subsp. malaccensis TaxID=214687 RepID=A0A804L3K8_MUSAM|nr:PREDICTED: protein SPIRAL1-like 5 [Musa acuminata subsp. malaccensis]CAG1863376.1 unnamed protein product [Musa acuminata subsp. malaccensis]